MGRFTLGPGGNPLGRIGNDLYADNGADPVTLVSSTLEEDIDGSGTEEGLEVGLELGDGSKDLDSKVCEGKSDIFLIVDLYTE